MQGSAMTYVIFGLTPLWDGSSRSLGYHQGFRAVNAAHDGVVPAITCGPGPPPRSYRVTRPGGCGGCGTRASPPCRTARIGTSSRHAPGDEHAYQDQRAAAAQDAGQGPDVYLRP